MSDPSTHVEATAPFSPGMLIGHKFVLLRLIAEGAVAAVYEAKDELIQRHVAIKLLHAHHAHDADIVRRFRREAEATATVQHPNVVGVFEMGQRRDGSFFIVQELLRGKDVRAHLAARKRLSIDEALGVMLPIADALIAAHASGVVHRDVKPENIVLAQVGSGEIVPKLIDFGTAKVQPGTSAPNLAKGVVLGSAAYMSPEQLKGQTQVDARTDVWAVGAILYEMLAGVRAFDGKNLQVLATKIAAEPVPRIQTVAKDVPTGVAAVIHRALERDLALRHPSMRALRDELLPFAGRSRQTLAQTLGASIAPPPPDDVRHTPVPRSDLAPAERLLALDDAPPPSAIPISVSPASQGFGGGWLSPAEAKAEIDAAEPASVETPRSGTLPPGIDWAHDGTARPSSRVEPAVEKAEHALSVNRLEEAIALAEAAIGGGALAATSAGRMLLVEAVAHRWLGNYAAAEEKALQATRQLPRASGAWYAALGYVVIASGHLGNRKRLLSILEEVKRIELPEGTATFHAILLYRLSIFLLRCGLHNVAQRIYLDAQGLMQRNAAVDLSVRAWADATRGELDMYRGDLPSYLRRIESAAESYTAAGDLRNACLQRSNIGNAFMQFGAYRRAAGTIREALAVAEPMKLDFVPILEANLGFALAQLGEIDQAIEIARVAIERCARLRHARIEAFTRVYLATMHALRGERDLATEVARGAVEMLDRTTAIRAYALGTLGLLLLEQRQTAPALSSAQEAVEIMGRVGGVEEGESLIRTVHALAVRAAGKEAEGRKLIADARKRLIERADRIKDPHWRQSFLERVPDNARLLRLAAQWLDSSPPSSPQWVQ